MRLPPPAPADHFYDLVGQRVSLSVGGQRIRGRLLSVRDGFLTIDPDHGRRISVNRYEVSTIEADGPKVSRSPRLSRQFWK